MQIPRPDPDASRSYEFDEGAGAAVTDTSGNSNNGLITGTTAWVAGRAGHSGNALQITDTGLVTVPAAASINVLSNGVSVEGWIFRTSNVTQQDAVVAKGRAYGWLAGWNGGGTARQWLNNVAYDFNPFPSAGTWHHVVTVYDRDAQTYKTYVDGVQNGTVYSGMNVAINNTTALTMQRRGATSVSLDQVRVYAAPLSATEITALFNKGSLTSPMAPGETLIYDLAYLGNTLVSFGTLNKYPIPEPASLSLLLVGMLSLLRRRRA